MSAAFEDEPIPHTMKSFPTIACESVAMMKAIVLGTDAAGILPLIARRTLSPIGETFLRMLQEEDAKILAFERAAADELVAPLVHVDTRATEHMPRKFDSSHA